MYPPPLCPLNSHCAHVSIKAREDDISLSRMFIDHLENAVSHFVSVKIRKVILDIMYFRDRIFDLYIEPQGFRNTVQNLKNKEAK